MSEIILKVIASAACWFVLGYLIASIKPTPDPLYAFVYAPLVALPSVLTGMWIAFKFTR